jgi:hypothetical protein
MTEEISFEEALIREVNKARCAVAEGMIKYNVVAKKDSKLVLGVQEVQTPRGPEKKPINAGQVARELDGILRGAQSRLAEAEHLLNAYRKDLKKEQEAANGGKGGK